MKDQRLPVLAVVLVLLFISSSASLATFPASPDGKIVLQMQQGWVNDQPAWYISTDTNDIRTACSQYMKPYQTLNLAPKLTSLLPVDSTQVSAGAMPMYVITNASCTQGPVFCVPPGDDDYTGKWQVINVTYKSSIPSALRHNVTNCDLAGPGNLTGLPSSDDADYVCTNIVVDYAIMAIGQLGGPWRSTGPNIFFRIPEGITHDPCSKTITLPTYNAYCTDPVTKRVMTARFILTAVNDSDVALRLGLIYADEISGIDSDNAMEVWSFGSFDMPPTQIPLLQACPTPLGCRNTNYVYSPIFDVSLINRRNVRMCTVFTNTTTLYHAFNYGLISESSWVRFEGSVVGYL